MLKFLKNVVGLIVKKGICASLMSSSHVDIEVTPSGVADLPSDCVRTRHRPGVSVCSCM